MIKEEWRISNSNGLSTNSICCHDSQDRKN